MSKGMKSYNYCIVFGWMMNELYLSSNELLVFAIIYGFSQDGVTMYKGGRKYLSETLNVSLPTVDKSLKSLIDKNYIERSVIKINGVEFHEYRVNLDMIKNLYHPEKNFVTLDKDILFDSKETLPSSSKETLPSNNSNSTIREINSSSKETVQSVLDSVHITDVELYNAIGDFIDMRKKLRKPLTPRAMKMLLNKLWKLSCGDYQMMRKIIERSILKGWQDVYPYEDDTVPRRQMTAIVQTAEARVDNPFTALKREERL